MEAEHSNNITPGNVISAYRPLPLGTVIKTFVTDTNPPKFKRYIIVGYYGNDAVTIYFNSKINEFVNYSQELQALHLPFTPENRSYLTGECYCDCSCIKLRDKDAIHAAVKSDPSVELGMLDDEDLDVVMTTLKKSTNLKGVYKKRYGFYDYETLAK